MNISYRQLARNESVLRAKESELAIGLRNREGLATEPEAEYGDQIQRAADRALVVQTLDRNSTLLREVRAALVRIQDGTYGDCVWCDERISAKRLAAVPWAPLCLMCQEKADRDHASYRAEPQSAAVS